MVGGIGRNADPDGGVVVPDFHVGCEPHRKRVVAGPFERLTLSDEAVVIALRPADRPRRRLGPGDAGRQCGRQQARRPSKAQALRNEFPTVMTLMSHGAALRSFVVCWFGDGESLPRHTGKMKSRSGASMISFCRCRYPAWPRYRGSGSPKEATSFVC